MRIIALFLSFSIVSIASENRAKEAFLADKAVSERATRLGAGYQMGESQVTFLKQDCGFLGCVTDYLVGAPLRNDSVSSHASSVLAKVVLIGDTPSLVQVLPEYTISIVTQ